jgi:hypothetical protein
MNVNITGIYDNTVIVDNNLFEDVRLLQTIIKKFILVPVDIVTTLFIKMKKEN